MQSLNFPLKISIVVVKTFMGISHKIIQNN